jgi:hypothetical protein
VGNEGNKLGIQPVKPWMRLWTRGHNLWRSLEPRLHPAMVPEGCHSGGGSLTVDPWPGPAQEAAVTSSVTTVATPENSSTVMS